MKRNIITLFSVFSILSIQFCFSSTHEITRAGALIIGSDDQGKPAFLMPFNWQINKYTPAAGDIREGEGHAECMKRKTYESTAGFVNFSVDTFRISLQMCSLSQGHVLAILARQSIKLGDLSSHVTKFFDNPDISISCKKVLRFSAIPISSLLVILEKLHAYIEKGGLYNPPEIVEKLGRSLAEVEKDHTDLIIKVRGLPDITHKLDGRYVWTMAENYDWLLKILSIFIEKNLNGNGGFNWYRV